MITIYTDGSSLGNPGKGGYAAILINGDHEKRVSGGYRRTTNNRMELKAVIEGLKALNKAGNVTIKTDSRLICDSFNKGWINGWIKRGWKKADKTPVLNSDLLKELLALTKIHNVKFDWVKAHAGIYYNEECDELAKESAQVGTAIDTFYETGQSSPSSTAKTLDFTAPKVLNKPFQISQKPGRLHIETPNSTIEILNDNLEDFIDSLKGYL